MSHCGVIEYDRIVVRGTLKSSFAQNGRNKTSTFGQRLQNSNNDIDKANIAIEMLDTKYALFTAKSEKVIDLIADDVMTMFGKQGVKMSKDFESVLKDALRSRYMPASEVKEKDGDGENSRHDEAVSGTVQQMLNRTKKQQLNYLFKKVKGATVSIPAEFKAGIVERAFYNVETGKFVTSEFQFNRSILAYQRDLFHIVATYLADHGETIENTDLYQGADILVTGGTINPEANNIMRLAAELIAAKQDNVVGDGLSEHDITLQQGWSAEQQLNYGRENSLNRIISINNARESLAYYRFVQAWYTLTYFDDALEQEFGKTVSFNPLLRNAFVTRLEADPKKEVRKYFVGRDKSGRYTGFSDDNKRNGFTEQGRFSVALLESLPLYSYSKFRAGETNYKRKGQYIDQIRITTAFAKIQDAVIHDEITSKSEGTETANWDFINAVMDLHANPKKNISTILDVLFRGKTYTSSQILSHLMSSRKYKLSPNEVDALFSLWKSVYSTQPDEETGYSIIKSENNTRSKFFNRDGYIYSDCISGLIDRVTELKYLSVEYDKYTGAVSIGLRKKFTDTSNIYRLRDLVNHHINSKTNRQELVDKYKITDNGDGSFRVNVDGLILEIDPNYNKSGDNTIFSGSNNNAVLVVRQKGNTTEKINVDDYFEDVDFSSAESIKQVLDPGSEISKILGFLTDAFGIDFKTDDNIQILHLYSMDSTNRFRDLLDGAFRAVLFNKVLNLYEKSKMDTLENFLMKENPYGLFAGSIGSLTKGNFEAKDTHIIYRFGDTFLLDVAPIKSNWLTGFKQAQDTFNGELLKSTSKNFAGNSEQNGRTSHLGANIQHYIQKAIKAKEEYAEYEASPKDWLKSGRKPVRQAASGFLLFSSRNTRKLISGQIMSSDIKAKDGTVKAIKSLKAGELLFTKIFHNYFGALASEDLAGMFTMQPTVYSDKGSIIDYIISSSKFKLSEKGKSYSLADLSDDETAELLYSTVGQFYGTVASNTIADFHDIFSHELAVRQGVDPGFTFKGNINFKTLTEVNKFLLDNKFSETELVRMAQNAGITLEKETQYTIYQGKVVINPLLQWYAYNQFASKEAIKSRLESERVEFINSILKSNLFIQTDDPAVSNIIENVLGSDRKLWVKAPKGENEGVLILAKILDSKGKVIREITQGALLTDEDLNGNTLQLNPIFAKYFNSYSVVAPNLRLTLTGSDLAHPLKKTAAFLTKRGSYVYSKLKEAGITAKDLGFKGSITEAELAAQEADIVTLGEHLSNLNTTKQAKAKEIFNNEMIALSSIAGTEGVQLKRNVIIPATLQYVQQGAINTLPRKVKVAVISDIKAFVNTFSGDTGAIDSQDGSALINPFFSILENLGLQDQATGIDKKPIWHHYNNSLGTATLLKFATFTMTNLRMMQSLQSDTNLYNLFKKMTNLQWRDANGWTNSQHVAIDLVNGMRYGVNSEGEPITKIDFTRDIRQRKDLFYGQNGLIRKIIDFGYTKFDGIGNNIYYTDEAKVDILGREQGHFRVYHLYDADGNHYRMSYEQVVANSKNIGYGPRAKFHTINSLFELHSAMGGVFSLERKNGKFVSSERSNEVVVNFMNIVGGRTQISSKAGNGSRFKVVETLTQDDYYQPLKEMMIGMAANTTAVKNGQANVNPSSSWRDSTPLTYTELDTDGYGIQQDSDHEADEAEMSEPTQVMTSLDQGGYLHKYVRQIYKSVGRVTLSAARVELDAVADFLERHGANPKDPKAINKLYDIVGRIIMNNLSSNADDMDLSEEILQEIRNEFGIKSDDHTLDSLKIAFSDPNLYGHILPTIISTLNSKGIRRKNPGSGMVMAPAFGIYQTFRLNGNTVTLPDIIRQVQFAPDEIVKTENGESLAQDQLTVNFLQGEVQKILQTEQQNYGLGEHADFDLSDVVNVYGSKGTEPVVLSIDTVPKLYALKDHRWSAFSKNAKLIERAAAATNNTFEGIITSITLNGYNNTLAALVAQGGLTEEEADILKNDPYLRLYESTTYQFQENVIKGRDLAPTRIRFTETIDGVDRRLSIYDIPVIRQAFEADKDHKVPRKLINTVFDDLSKGYYYEQYEVNTGEDRLAHPYVGIGTPHQVRDAKYYMPQAIVSNMWATRFGVDTSMTLEQVKSENLFNKNAFLESIASYPEGDEVSEMRFMKANGQHTYVTFKRVVRSDSNRKIQIESRRLNNFRKEKSVINKHEVYSTIAMDSQNFDIMEVGRQVERTDLTVRDNKVYNGDQLVNNDGKFSIVNGKVFQNFKIVNVYNYKQGTQTDTLYSIDYEAAKEMFNVLGDPNGVIGYVGELTETIYNRDTYIAFDQRIKENHKELIGTWRGKKGTGVVGTIGTKHSDVADLAKDIIAGKDVNLEPILDKLSAEVHTSFLMSQQVIASRIPAQTLQSFMPMEIVGYTQMEQNVAYVSHIQTFLQGSDYDIDKSYMLTYFFDDNGRFITWSPIMSLASKEELDESIKVGIPNGTKLVSANNNALAYNFEDVTKLRRSAAATRDEAKKAALLKEAEVTEASYINDLLSTQVDITDSLLQVLNAPDNVSRISALADLIDFVDQNSQDVNLKKLGETPVFYYTYDTSRISKADADAIIATVQEHEDFIIPEAVREKAYQNANSAKISIIIKDWHNINSAHTPVNMDDAHAVTERRLGHATRMTLFNPGVVPEMQVENQVGKNVIGIAANGEKAFFTLYYYFTELFHKLIKDPNNEDLRKYLTFEKTFTRIQNRWAADDPENKKLPERERETIKTETKTHIGNLNHLMTLKGDDLDYEIDQMISQLLSAATDNAKELILAKINAGEEFAKIFFYGLVLGFSLNDLAAFMTSPAVDLVAQLSTPNIFDPTNKVNTNQVLRILLYGDYPFRNYFGRNAYAMDAAVKGEVVKTVDGKKVTLESLQHWAQLKNAGKITITLAELVNSVDEKNIGTEENPYRTFKLTKDEPIKLIQLSEYIEGVSSKIAVAIDESGGLDSFKADLVELKQLIDLSDEMTTLTNVYLNTNQGLPTTLDKYLKRLLGIQNTVRNREKAITEYDAKGKEIRSVKSALAKSNHEEKVIALVDILQDVNGQYRDLMVDPDTGKVSRDPSKEPVSYYVWVADKAIKLGIAGNFSYEKWLTSPEYRKVTIDYYNLIKGTFNIFHFLEVHPQYNANFKLFGPSFSMITQTNLKTRLILAAQAKYQEDENYWDSSQNSELGRIADEVILRRFLKNQNFSMEIDSDWSILSPLFEIVSDHGKRVLNLDGGLDFSNFKFLMENYIVPGLKNGTLRRVMKNGKYQSISDNPFIRGINTYVKYNRPYLALDVDMSKRGVSADTNIKFEEYSQAFQELASYTINGFTFDGQKMTVQDLIVLYNLIVNKNQYGSDRFTSIFKSTISRHNKNSLLYKYIKFIGEDDQKAFTIDAMDLAPLVTDMQIAMAPTISAYQLKYAKDKYVKVKEHGLTTLYELNTKTQEYEIAKIFLNDFDEPVKPSSQQQINFAQYACLFARQEDTITILSNKIGDESAITVAEALRNLTGSQKLIISFKC